MADPDAAIWTCIPGAALLLLPTPWDLCRPLAHLAWRTRTPQPSPVTSFAHAAPQVTGGDPDGDAYECSLATAAESGIPRIAATGVNALSVSPDCTVSWNPTGTDGAQYAVQVWGGTAERIAGLPIMIVHLVQRSYGPAPLLAPSSRSASRLPVQIPTARH